MLLNLRGSGLTTSLTVCDNAKEARPVFFSAAERLHHSFDDPAGLNGSEEEHLALFRRVRGELRTYLAEFARHTE